MRQFPTVFLRDSKMVKQKKMVQEIKDCQENSQVRSLDSNCSCFACLARNPDCNLSPELELKRARTKKCHKFSISNCVWAHD